MALEYTLEQANDNYKFIIASSNWSVEGVMQNELALAGGNNFGTAGDVLKNIPIVGKALQIKESFGDVFKLSGRSNITDFETRMVWENSSKPSFNIEYKFYNTSSSQAAGPTGALSKAKTLQSTVLPNKGKPAIGRKGRFFQAPLGYKFAKSDVSGTVTLQVGKWFRATKLVVTATNFVPSIQVMENGQPLYVTGSITLEPYQAITYAEFLKFFRGSS